MDAERLLDLGIVVGSGGNIRMSGIWFYAGLCCGFILLYAPAFPPPTPAGALQVGGTATPQFRVVAVVIVVFVCFWTLSWFKDGPLRGLFGKASIGIKSQGDYLFFWLFGRKVNFYK